VGIVTTGDRWSGGARRRWRGGLTLFEAMLALAVFALLATGLGIGLREGGLAARDAMQQRRAALALQAFLDARLHPGANVEAGRIEQEDEAGRMRFVAEVAPLELTGRTADGQPAQLAGLYRVRATVVWGPAPWQQLEVETVRIIPAEAGAIDP